AELRSSPPSRSASAWYSKQAWVVLIFVMCGSVAIDLVTKWLAFRSIAGAPVAVVRDEVLAKAAVDPRMVGTLVPKHEPIVIIPRVLELTLVLNPGAVFGV